MLKHVGDVQLEIDRLIYLSLCWHQQKFFNFLLKYSWTRMLFQLPLYSKVTQLYKYIYILFRIFPIMVYHRILIFISVPISCGFPSGSDSKESTRNAGDLGLIPGSRWSPGEGHDNPFQYSCLEISMDKSLADYSPWGSKELSVTERIALLLSQDSDTVLHSKTCWLWVGQILVWFGFSGICLWDS